MDLLKNCNKAEIFTPSNQLICEAGVFHDLADRLQLLVPIDFAFTYKEHPFYFVVFYDPISGLINCRCTLSTPSSLPDGRQSLLCKIAEVLNRNQRRQDLKVPLSTEIELTGIRVSAEGRYPPVSRIPAVTRDISAGGIYFTCQYPLSVDTLATFQFRETAKPLTLSVRVLRQDQLKPVKGVDQYGHGCRFIDLEMDAESELRSYIFRRERQIHQNRR